MISESHIIIFGDLISINVRGFASYFDIIHKGICARYLHRTIAASDAVMFPRSSARDMHIAIDQRTVGSSVGSSVPSALV